MRKIVFILSILCALPIFINAEDKIIILKAYKQVALTGYTRFDTKMIISSEVPGKITKLNYDIGQIIKALPFFEIDSTFIDFEIKTTLNTIKKLEVSIQRSESRIAYSKKEFERIDTLFQERRATEVNRDAASEELKQAELEYQGIIAEKTILETTLQQLKERKSRHIIDAPEGWIVTGKMAEIGEHIAPQVPLAKIADYKTLVIPFSVSSKELNALRRLPQEFDVIVENKNAKAQINWVNPEFDERTRKLSMELKLIDYEGEKREGLLCSLSLTIDSEGLLIPKDAIKNRYDNPRIILKGTRNPINVIILSESERNFVIAEDEILKEGMELEYNDPETLPMKPDNANSSNIKQ
ncbi:MAG: HlyD family efflux transporter periplasmic adaptor subunit [Desulfobacterales bacterium]|nr:HlyD family efflux transporter periplasmic adaptor subunit [Desulfobacterales bacterium]